MHLIAGNKIWPFRLGGERTFVLKSTCKISKYVYQSIRIHIILRYTGTFSPLGGYQRFGGNFCLHLQSKNKYACIRFLGNVRNLSRTTRLHKLKARNSASHRLSMKYIQGVQKSLDARDMLIARHAAHTHHNTALIITTISF